LFCFVFFFAASELVKANDELLVCHACQFPEPIVETTLTPMGGAALVERRYLDEQKEHIKETGRNICSKFMEKCKEKNITCHSFLLTEGHAREQACTFARDQHVDQVVVGTRGHSQVQRFFLGSFSHYVINHCPCDVVLVKNAHDHSKHVPAPASAVSAAVATHAN
jgi:nucleotide-binding universal stress UspA family protein